MAREQLSVRLRFRGPIAAPRGAPTVQRSTGSRDSPSLGKALEVLDTWERVRERPILRNVQLAHLERVR